MVGLGVGRSQARTLNHCWILACSYHSFVWHLNLDFQLDVSLFEATAPYQSVQTVQNQEILPVSSHSTRDCPSSKGTWDTICRSDVKEQSRIPTNCDKFLFVYETTRDLASIQPTNFNLFLTAIWYDILKLYPELLLFITHILSNAFLFPFFDLFSNFIVLHLISLLLLSFQYSACFFYFFSSEIDDFLSFHQFSLS